MKTIAKQLLSSASALLLTAGLVPGTLTFAADEPVTDAPAAPPVPVEEIVPGDIDCDGILAYSDIAECRSWLSMFSSLNYRYMDEVLAKDKQYIRADMDGDGAMSAVDLSVMKQKMIEAYGTQKANWPVGNSRPPEENPDAWMPVGKAFEHQLHTFGEQRVLMIVIDFPDYPLEGGLTAEEIQARCFGPEDKESPAYPYESISAFYNRASGGKLKLSGDVFTYTAKNNLLDYYRFSGYAAAGKDVPEGTPPRSKQDVRLNKEALDALCASGELDFSRYDSDGNGCLDAVIYVLPNAIQKFQYDLMSIVRGEYDWWPGYNSYYECNPIVFDGVNYKQRRYYKIQGAADVTDQAGFNETWAHELGHAMGLDDFYDTAAAAGEDPLTMHGEAGGELMMAGGDLCAFNKTRLGWCTPDNMQVYTGGTQKFTIGSNQTTRDFLVIPRDVPAEAKDFGFAGDYFIVELNTPEANCGNAFEKGGMRILRFNWAKFAGLVNDGNGYFSAGEKADADTEGFTWKDGSAAGIQISFDQIADGKCTLTVSPAAGDAA